jgi:hypothetical protein
LAFSSEPVSISTGLAATLALLKNTGELAPGRGEKLVGRSKDARAVDPSSKDFNVKLEYRDETGRKLTQKEAFRQINYQFHGVAPGKKKQEKRLRQLELEDRLASSRVVTGEGGTMKSLMQAQQATGSAYVAVADQGRRVGVGGLAGAGAAGGGQQLTAAEVAAELYTQQQQHQQQHQQQQNKGGKK